MMWLVFWGVCEMYINYLKGMKQKQVPWFSTGTIFKKIFSGSVQSEHPVGFRPDHSDRFAKPKRIPKRTIQSAEKMTYS